jgi:FAD/FMN-containing dehydrogenase
MLIFMTTTSTTTSNQLHLDDLAGVRGAIIAPDDPRYDQARAVHNGAVDRYPLAIVQCADVADVIACVAYARDHVLPLAIRGGGHYGGGFAVWDNALVIDLSGLRSTSVDPVAGTVRVDGGCVWGDVDHATGAFGMALPSGFMSTTGVGGLTLGGGIGYLTRRFGLTLDNLVSADVVLADGRFVTASADSHSDLFWALRGGGGNFGVVTSFTFRCYPIGEHGVIIGGPVLYDIADVEELFRWYRDLLPTLPDELSAWIGVTQIPAAAHFPEHLWSRNACIVVWCYSGPHDRGRRGARPGTRLRRSAVGRPSADALLSAAGRLRRPHVARVALVLEDRLLRADHRRRHRRTSAIRRDDPDTHVGDAPAPDQRCGRSGA